MNGALQRLNMRLVNAADAVPGEQMVAAQARVAELTSVFDKVTRPSRHPETMKALARLQHASHTLERALVRAH